MTKAAGAGGKTASNKRMRWLSGGSAAALAVYLAAAPLPSQAQVFTPDPNSSFQATVLGTDGAGSVTRGPTVDTVTVSSDELLINWQPFDTNGATVGPDGQVINPIDILPEGRTLRFQSAGEDYTVLNRILPAATAEGRAIQFNGTVESLVGGVPGGNVWFYSPGGIIVGSTALFDVGSLVLTTNDIDTTGGFYGGAGEIRFRGVADSNSAVVFDPNNDTAPQVSLNAEGSYLGVVAPRIVQGGDVSVNGSVAYVAAEQADLTINNGLFDISIGVGTRDANGIVHSGSTSGTASTGTADAQAVYMVAVPKNDAVTMLVGGSIGFEPAASAAIVNGNVVLSAGADVAATGGATNAGFAIDSGAPASDSNIELQNTRFSSSVSAFAANGIVASTSSATDSIIVDDGAGALDLSLQAGNQIDINVLGGGSIAAGGDVTLRAGSGNAGGTININVGEAGLGGAFTTAGNLIVDTGAAGADDFVAVRANGNTGAGQDAVAGNIAINIAGSADLDVGGDAYFLADAQGGKGERLNGSGQGGDIDLNVSGGTFAVAGTTSFSTEVLSAEAGKATGNGAGIGGDSYAGNISLVALDGGAIDVGQSFFFTGAAANDGDGIGGDVLVHANDASIAFSDIVSMNTSGVGGDRYSSADRATGQAGAITNRVEGDDGSISFADISVVSTGSIVDDGDDAGGYGFGGNFIFDILGGTYAAGDIALDLDGTGGSSGGPVKLKWARPGSRSAAAPMGFATLAALTATAVSAGDGGDGIGGDVTFTLNGGNATVAILTVSANGFGGDGADGDFISDTFGGSGGSGIGGTAIFDAISGTLTVNNTLTISATGNDQTNAPFGASGAGGFGDGIDGGAGGAGIGGTATFNFDGATINANNIVITANAGGGSGGGSSDSLDALSNPVQAGVGGAGGDATGGVATFTNDSGALTFSTLTVNSVGTGGNGGSVTASTNEADNIGGNGGIGTGGTARVNLNQSDTTGAAYTVNASGRGGVGGDGFTGGDGGAAFGGLAEINVNNVAADLSNPQIIANADGGAGGDGRLDIFTTLAGNGGNGGSATAGTARLAVNGASGTIDLDAAVIQSNAFGGNGGTTPDNLLDDGGNGGDGGNATGGTAELVAQTGGTINLTSALFSLSSSGTGGTGGAGGEGAFAVGGDGGNGGNGVGGTGRLLAQGGTITGNNVDITTTGLGGNGGSFGPGVTPGAEGLGGIGTGGNAVLEVQDSGGPGIITLGAVNMVSTSVGGNSGSSATPADRLSGRIEIIDTSADPAGLITLDSLTAQALGDTAGIDSGFFVTGDSGAVSILGNLSVDVTGDIGYSFDGDGQMTVGGSASMQSGGAIQVGHSNNATLVTSIDVTGALAAAAFGGNVDLGQALLGGDTIQLTALIGSLLGSASLTSTNDIGITVAADVNAGSINAGGQLTSAALVGGALESTFTVPGNINIGTYTQGGAQQFRVEAGNNINFDQIILPGAAIQLLAAQSGPGDVFLGTTIGAGSILLEGENAGFTDLNATASAGNSINITATGGNISGGNAIASGSVVMTAVAGSSDVGDITSTGLGSSINLLASGATSDVVAGALTTNSGDILVSAGQDIALGSASTSSGIPTAGSVGLLAGRDVTATGTLAAGEDVAIQSAGDVSLATVTAGDDLVVQAGGAVTLDTATVDGSGIDFFSLSLDAANAGEAGSIGFAAEPATLAGSNIQITSGGNLNATGELFSADGIVLDAGGTVDYSDATAGGLVDIDGTVITGNSITAGTSVDVLGTALNVGDVTAVQTIDLQASSGNITAGFLSGADLTLGAVGGNISTLEASGTNVAITADGNIDAGIVSATGTATSDIVLNAGGTVGFSDATADGLIDIDGAIVNGGPLTAGTTVDAQANALTVGDVDAGQTINLQASNGSITAGTLGGTDVTLGAVGGDITTEDVSGTSVAFTTDGNISAGSLLTIGTGASDISLNAAGTIGFISADAVGLINIDGTAVTGGDLSSGTSVTVQGTVLDLGTVVAGSSSSLTAVGGGVSVGDVTTNGLGSSINIFASGSASDIVTGALTTTSGDILVSAGQDITLASAATAASAPTAGSIGVLAGGNLSATGTVSAGEDVAFQAAGNVALDAVSAGDDIAVQGGGDVSLASATVSGSGIDLFSMALNPANAGQAGSIAFAAEQAALSGSNIQLTSGNNLNASGDLSSANGILLNAGGTAGFGTAMAGGLVDIAGTVITGGAITAGTSADILGTEVTVGDVTGTTLVTVAASSGNVSTGALQSDGAITANAGGDVTLASATSNAGGTIGVTAGGAALLGDITTAADIAINTGSNLSAAILDAGTDIDVTAGGSAAATNVISGASTSMTGQSVTLNNGTIGTDLALNATAGDLDATGTFTVGGAIDLDATGNADFGTLAAAGGAFDVDAGGDITFTSASSADAANLTAVGNINGGAVTSTGDTVLNAGGTVGFTSVTADGLVDIDGTAVTGGAITAGTSVDVDADTIAIGQASGSQISLTSASGGSIEALALNATGAIDIEAGTGGFTGTELNSGGALTMASGGDIVFDTAMSGGNVQITGSGDLAANAITSAASPVTTTAKIVAALPAIPGSVEISADQGIELGSVTGDNVELTSTGGNIAVRTDANVTGELHAAGQNVLLRSSHDLNVLAQASGGNVDIATAGSLNVLGADATGDVSLVSAADVLLAGSTNAQNALSINAGNLIDIQALASGTDIAMTSADIAIASTGQLGRSDQTQSLTISNDGTTQLVLGGTGTAGSFSIDGAEFARIHSGNDLAITAVGAGMLIQDLDVTAGTNSGAPDDGNIGSAGSLTLSSDGDIRIDGAVSLTNANSANTLAINAANELRIRVLSGSLQAGDGSGNLAGNIDLTASSIVAATDSAVADIAGQTLADASERLVDSDGNVLPDGYIQAENLTLNVAEGLFIQNSGAGAAFDARRGFRANNLTINAAGVNPIQIAINGVVGTVTGGEALDAAVVAPGVDAQSTFNGCLIGVPSSCASPTLEGPVQDIIAELAPTNPADPGSDPSDSNLIELNDLEEFVEDPQSSQLACERDEDAQLCEAGSELSVDESDLLPAE